MRVAYISCLSAPEPSLSEYSNCFVKVLQKVSGTHVTTLDLSSWEHRSGQNVYQEVKALFSNFIKKHGSFDYYHFELVNHHLMVWACLMAKRNLALQGKVIVTVHDPPLLVNGRLGLHFTESRLAHKLARLVDFGCPQLVFRDLDDLIDGALFLSSAGEAVFRKHWKHKDLKTGVIPHVPFDLPANLERRWLREAEVAQVAEENKRLTVFFAGLWWKHKGLEELIKAVEILATNGIDLDLTVSGSGPKPYVTKIKEKLENLRKVGVNVCMPGHLELADLYEMGRSADCWVIPYKKSKEVSASGIMLRAIACGAYVVATDLPQFEELFDNGVEGVLYDHSCVEALSKAIEGSRLAPRADQGRVLEELRKEIGLKVVDLYQRA